MARVGCLWLVCDFTRFLIDWSSPFLFPKSQNKLFIVFPGSHLRSKEAQWKIRFVFNSAKRKLFRFTDAILLRFSANWKILIYTIFVYNLILSVYSLPEAIRYMPHVRSYTPATPELLSRVSAMNSENHNTQVLFSKPAVFSRKSRAWLHNLMQTRGGGEGGGDVSCHLFWKIFERDSVKARMYCTFRSML